MARPLSMFEWPTPQAETVHANACVPICAAVGVKLQTAVEERLEPEQPKSAIPENP
jgi:hypothetical protein